MFQSGVNPHKHVYVQLLLQDPKAAKGQSSRQCLFEVLGSLSEKAARKTLVKSTRAVVVNKDIFKHVFQLKISKACKEKIAIISNIN